MQFCRPEYWSLHSQDFALLHHDAHVIFEPQRSFPGFPRLKDEVLCEALRVSKLA